MSTTTKPSALTAATEARCGRYTIRLSHPGKAYPYTFEHDDYIGSGDHRCGLGTSVQYCIDRIDAIEAEHRPCFCDLCHRDVPAVRNRVIGKGEDDRVKACEECYHRPLTDFAF